MALLESKEDSRIRVHLIDFCHSSYYTGVGYFILGLVKERWQNWLTLHKIFFRNSIADARNLSSALDI